MDTNYPLNNPPPVLHALSSGNWECKSIDLAKPFSLQRLSTTDISTFYAILTNPKRCTPIILISPETREQQVSVDAENLAQRMFGLAHVYQLEDEAAVEGFKEVIGAALACYDGVVRLYWPWQSASRVVKHPYRKIRNYDPHELQTWLFQLVAQESPRYSSMPEVLRHLDHQQRRDEQQQKRNQLARLQHTESKIDGWHQLLEEAIARNDSLEDENVQLKKSKQELESQVLDLHRQLQTAIENLSIVPRHDEGQGDFVFGDQGLVPLGEDEHEPKLYLSAEAWARLHAAPANQREEFEQELQKLCMKPDLRKSNSKRISKKKTDCLIFPQGDKGVRLFYYEHTDGSLRVCELADHRDSSYEDLIDRCKVFKKEYPDAKFKPLEMFSTALV